MVAKPKPLNDRDQAVLRLVVERFISTAEPVASQALGELQVSSATIRNTMAKLEAHGLLEQPHTSAGRVPTEAGLRLYVDQLMATQPLTQREQSQIETKLLPKLQGSSVYTSGAKGLAEVASHLAVVVPPRLPTTIFETIELVKAGDKRLVVVCVSRGGDVHHKLIELGEDIERHTLDRMNALLREVFSGLSLVDIRTRLAAELSAERAREDQLYRKTIELAVRGVPEVDQAEVCVEGTSQILMQADAAQVQKLLTAVEEKRLLLSVLERLANDGESHIGLGVRELAGLAVVAAPFGGEGGVLAVVGPMRMNYARLVPVVAYCANIMTKHLGALP